MFDLACKLLTLKKIEVNNFKQLIYLREKEILKSEITEKIKNLILKHDNSVELKICRI